MSIDADSYSVSGPVKGITKQHAVWLNTGATSRVLCYLQRPKSVTDDEWQEFLDGVTLNLKKKNT